MTSSVGMQSFTLATHETLDAPEQRLRYERLKIAARLQLPLRYS
jgi:hypothetical protein